MPRFQLERYGIGPILSPHKDFSWESEGVFNPGVLLLNNEVIMLYRAVGERISYTSYIGCAKSKDGITFERLHDRPVFGPGKHYDQWATEDPRITMIDGKIYVTYVAVPERILDNGKGIIRALPLETSGALLKTDDFLSYERCGIISPEGSDNKDVVLFPKKINGRFAMLHRPNRWSREWFKTPYSQHVKEHAPCAIEDLPDFPGIWIAYSDDLRVWDTHRLIVWATHHEDEKIGPGLPPLETPEGWLLIYHHVEKKDGRIIYAAHAALFDLNDPTKLISKLPYDILSPDMPFENSPGAGIVFPTGGFIKGDELWIYYGILDRAIGLARGSVSALLTELIRINKML